MTKLIFLLQFALCSVLAVMAWKLGHTSKAPLESERDAFTRLAWVDRSGVVPDSIDLKGRYIQPRLSADGKTALLTRLEPGRADIWSLSISTRTVRRLTAAKKRSAFAVWGPAGDQYLFAFQGQLLQKTSGTNAEPLFVGDIPDIDWLLLSSVPEDWSADGRMIAFAATDHGRPSDLFLMDTRTGAPYRLFKNETVVNAYEARFSRDGHWIALTSDMSGRNEVYVSAVPSDLSRLPVPRQSLIRVSRNGGNSPVWGPNGELLYVGAGGDLFAIARADIRSPSAPQTLFRISSIGLPAYEYRFGGYSMGGNGQRFLVALSARPR